MILKLLGRSLEKSTMDFTFQRTFLSLLVTCCFVMMTVSGTKPVRIPTFDSPTANVTVKELSTAILPCSVRNLGSHQVIWVDQGNILLTYEDRRVIDDTRVTVERPFVKDWNLHIRDVNQTDQGTYTCQINTNPVKIRRVSLFVMVPPKIHTDSMKKKMFVREGERVTLLCNVSGIPTPSVTWYRLSEDQKGEHQQSEFCPSTNKVGKNGEMLIIHNISRHCGDTYVCRASNGVPPDSQMFIDVSVQFPPEVKVANERIGQDLGKETSLECIITAHPQVDGHWYRGNKKMKTESGHYRIEVYKEGPSTYIIFLRILSVREEDYGAYTCIAGNDLGKDSGTTVLYNYIKSRPTTTTTTSTSPVPSVAPFGSWTDRVHSQGPPLKQYKTKDAWRSTNSPFIYGRARIDPLHVDSGNTGASRAEENGSTSIVKSTSLNVVFYSVVSTVIMSSSVIHYGCY